MGGEGERGALDSESPWDVRGRLSLSRSRSRSLSLSLSLCVCVCVCVCVQRPGRSLKADWPDVRPSSMGLLGAGGGVNHAPGTPERSGRSFAPPPSALARTTPSTPALCLRPVRRGEAECATAHLQQHVVHVRVRLLDLVEEHERMRRAAHGLRQLAARLVPHVPAHSSRCEETPLAAWPPASYPTYPGGGPVRRETENACGGGGVVGRWRSGMRGAGRRRRRRRRRRGGGGAQAASMYSDMSRRTIAFSEP